MTDKKTTPKAKKKQAPTKRGKEKSSSASTNKKPVKPTGNKPSRWRVLWGFCWKASLALSAVLVVWGVYLNAVVKERFEGHLFSLPTVVYARILDLSPGEGQTIEQIRDELDILNYRKVSSPKFAGEYSMSAHKIELIRRPFAFPDGESPDRHVMLYFDQQGLQRIHSLDSSGDLGFLRLDPKMLGMLEKNSDEQRLFLRRDQFPEMMIDALLTTEDRDFYQHDGVEPLSIARALLANIRAGRTVQGGSTLTQQLAKNLFLSRDRTLWRKLQEAYIALILDHKYSKDRILQAYLNEVYLGQSGSQAIHGFGLAARYYFGQPIQELRIDQLAMLVGLVKGPSYYNPVRYPERAKKRRDLVLRLMMNENLLSSKQYNTLASRPLGLQAKPHVASRQPAYFQQVSREIKRTLGDQFKAEEGLRVFTSLDPISQDRLEQAVQYEIPQLEKRTGHDLQVAAVAVARQSGEIRAMIGGKHTQYDGYNRAISASRQIGSLAKPAVYLTALSEPEKYDLATTLQDTPLTLESDDGQRWQPQNYDRKFRGEVPLYQGLAKSLNVPTVRLGMELGIDNVSETMEKIGIDGNEIRPVPSMFLGSFSLSPFSVAQMFQTITNSGRKAPLTALRYVMDVKGNVLYRSLPRASQVVPEQAAWLTTYAMKMGVLQGTGRHLQQSFSWAALAGKTGTSNDTRDSWFVGVDGREVTTLWVGRDNNKPTQLTGASGALRVYEQYLLRRQPEMLQLPWPQNIKTMGFDHNDQGGLSLNCQRQPDIKLPVWDRGNQWQQRCEKSKTWFQRVFDW
ncbi:MULTISPECIES: penicillin-binding protein 1B [unclassified Vibrio]|uniref:Penicillin-binding protein 1B n=1 Tax=Vibrio sp. HB236076 TaxID=3232307 RepID=A0AB39HB89_9VIBR|nr:penicillin-binding protein 1B [Vibrio sp. HB161653]MDP5254023.1 penicillin-binding protein 1B [Vibrio sp. HB161653]